jgi:hypothetical protein
MQPQILNQWLAGVIQSLALSDALAAFHAATDKEIASMAAYKALGLNPADAPRFGWNQSERPGTRIVSNTTNIGVPPEAPAEKTAATAAPQSRLSRLLPAALLGGACLLAGGGGAAGVNWLTKPSPGVGVASPPSTAGVPQAGQQPSKDPKPQEYDIQFRIEGGELKIDPPIPVQPGNAQ